MITILKDTTRKLPAIFVGLSLVAFLGIGCSLDSTGVGPNSESSTEETTTYIDGVTPDIQLPEGLELVSMSEMAIPRYSGSLDDPPGGGNSDNENAPDLCNSGWVSVADGGTVTFEYSGCAIDAGEMPFDAEVTVCLPHPGYAFVEFGPHPLYFNGEVEIWFDLSVAHCPPQQYDQLQMWYVNDNEDLEPIEMEIDFENMRATGHTTHFSRYILTKATVVLK